MKEFTKRAPLKHDPHLTEQKKEDVTPCYERLGSLVDYNQRLLATLGVSHPSLDRVCSVAATHGLHAKLTGAGGGGYAYVLVPPGTKSEQLEKTVAELRKDNFDCWETELGVDGVVVKNLAIPKNCSSGEMRTETPRNSL